MSTLTDYLSINQSQTESPIISAEEEIRHVEIEWGDAFEHHDVATLDRLMADEYFLTDPLGVVRSKAETIAAIQRNEVLFQSTNSESVNISVNGDTAVVTGRSTFRGRYKGWSMAGQYQYTDVLVKRSGSWKAVASHITALGTGALRLRVGFMVCNLLL
jgi:ketosteroid isomerase-like protein